MNDTAINLRCPLMTANRITSGAGANICGTIRFNSAIHQRPSPAISHNPNHIEVNTT
jgi:hypothetical protein